MPTRRDGLASWIDRYETAWRTAGTAQLRDLFAPTATYSAAPFEPPITGLAAIASFWEAEREGPDERFELAWAPVAVEGKVGVTRVEVRYAGPPARVYRDLWIVTLDDDGRCVAFEEWPFFPDQPHVSGRPIDDPPAPAGWWQARSRRVRVSGRVVSARNGYSLARALQYSQIDVVGLTPSGLTLAEVLAVARGTAQVSLSAGARAGMERGAGVVADLSDAAEPTYGVSTGFGSLATVRIPAQRREELQRALVRSHAAGMGPPVEREVVRAMMLLRARTLAMGFSGARPVVAETILALLNAGLTPLVPEHGSLGASGDLAPLAHCALVLIGEGEVNGPDQSLQSAAQALSAAGIDPVVLTAKEGLALINGTDGMLGMLVMAIDDIERLLRVADISAAMSVEALLGTDRVFAAELLALRPQPGQAASAANLRALLAESEIVASHRYGDSRVQDAYSLRCAPQVAGAARDTLAHAERVADAELRSAIDNPMVLPDGRVESCGNFHGAPLGFVCDFLAIAAAEVGAIAERRTDRLLDPARSHGLPPFLAEDPGVNSGLMIAHYSQAAMVAENRRLAAPASVDSLPTSAMQEDHVSMGWGAARKLRVAVANLGAILTVELVCAARALELRAPLRPAPGTAAALAGIRELIPGPGPDRYLAPELAAVQALVASGTLLEDVESAIGAMQ